MLAGTFELEVDEFLKTDEHFNNFACDKNVRQRLKIEALYYNPVVEQVMDVEEMKMDENLIIPVDINFHHKSLNLSTEERQKLSEVRPQTVIFYIHTRILLFIIFQMQFIRLCGSAIKYSV